MAPEETGKMGWGHNNGLPTQWQDEENRAYDQLCEDMPKCTVRHEAREPNQELIDKVKESMKQDGIEDGFSFLHLSKVIFNEELPWLRQLIGSCVASGDMRTTTYRMLAEVFLLNDTESMIGKSMAGRTAMAFYAPYNYRAGRKFAGINGRSDGSLCLPHIRGKMTYGHLPCSVTTLKSDRFPEPTNQSLYKDWGANDSLMNRFTDEGKKYLLTESEKVTSAEDAKVLLMEHFKPMNICSMYAFEPTSTRLDAGDSQGKYVLYRRSRQSWAHNMSIVAVLKINGKWYATVENSWGTTHSGRRYFIIELDLLDSWLRNANCHSVGDIDLPDNEIWKPKNATTKKTVRPLTKFKYPKY